MPSKFFRARDLGCSIQDVAWRDEVEEHLDALRSLLRNPALAIPEVRAEWERRLAA